MNPNERATVVSWLIANSKPKELVEQALGKPGERKLTIAWLLRHNQRQQLNNYISAGELKRTAELLYELSDEEIGYDLRNVAPLLDAIATAPDTSTPLAQLKAATNRLLLDEALKRSHFNGDHVESMAIRAGWAQTALDAYTRTHETDDDDVGELLGDLATWCHIHDVDFVTAAADAAKWIEAEINGPYKRPRWGWMPKPLAAALIGMEVTPENALTIKDCLCALLQRNHIYATNGKLFPDWRNQNDVTRALALKTWVLANLEIQ
jgi:hypothetical protein